LCTQFSTPGVEISKKAEQNEIRDFTVRVTRGSIIIIILMYILLLLPVSTLLYRYSEHVQREEGKFANRALAAENTNFALQREHLLRFEYRMDVAVSEKICCWG